MKTILLDAGHGGHDPGRPIPGPDEKDFNLLITLALGDFLISRGIDVRYTRITDVFVSLEDRQRMVASIKPAAFVSVHCNGVPDPRAHGFEIFYRDDEDKRLADRVAHYMRRTGLYDRGVFQDVARLAKRLAMLSNVPVPSILVECGFLTNPDDLQYLRENGPALAEVIGHGIADYFLGENHD